MSIGQLSMRLNARAEMVCRELLPNGVRRYGRWECGSVRGEAGSSLKVEVQGDRCGVWADFASGEKGGDLLDLWMAVRGVTLVRAMEEAAAFLGVRVDAVESRPHREFRVPERPRCAAVKDGAWMEWLRGRGIAEETVRAYRLATNGDELIFPYLRDGAFVNAKYRRLPKSFRQEGGAKPVLFGWNVLDERWPNTRTVALSEGECFTGEAQLLTPSGWVYIKDYVGGPVAQWERGRITFVEPLARICKPFDGELIEYSSRQFYSLTTPGHKMVSVGTNGVPYFHTAQEGPRSRQHRIPRCGVADGPGIPLSDDQIALCVAVSADATIDVRKNACGDGPARKMSRYPRYVRFCFKRQRKIARLEAVVKALEIPISNQPIANGYRSMGFGIPDWVPGKMLPWEWIEQATAAQREFILRELIEWDGHRVPNRTMTEYSSTLIENAEWVQAMAHSTGRCSSIVYRENDYGAWYQVTILNQKSTSSWQSVSMDRIHYKGDAYCVQVPSGAIMVRQKGIVSVSGNCDAMALYQYGIPALSVPMGGGGGRKQDWIDEEFDRMLRFETIYIMTDMDEAGDRAAAEISRRLGEERCRRVRLPFKDANECLMHGVTAEQMQGFLRAAASNDPDELKRAGEFTDEVLDLFDGGTTQTIGVKLPFASDEFRLRPAEVTILSGYSGSGKSKLLSHLAVEGMMQGTRWCVASMEMPARTTLAGMVCAIARTPKPDAETTRVVMRWLNERCWLFDVRGTARSDRMLDVFDYAARRYAMNYYTVDSLSKCGMAEDDYNGHKKFVENLSDLCHTHRCGSILVAHARKQESEAVRPRKHDVRGSTAITDMADNVITLWRDKREDANNRAEFIVDKQRATGWEGTIELHYDPDCQQFVSKNTTTRNYLAEIMTPFH